MMKYNTSKKKIISLVSKQELESECIESLTADSEVRMQQFKTGDKESRHRAKYNSEDQVICAKVNGAKLQTPGDQRLDFNDATSLCTIKTKFL